MKQTIIISGINGFLGNRLKEMLKDEFIIYGIAKEEYFNEEIYVFSSEKIEEIKVKPDFLILCHAAVSSGTIGQTDDLLYDINVKLTAEIIARFNNSKIIYISSASIYHFNEGTISETTTNNPMNEYSISKLWAEKLVLKTKRATVIRLSSLYGIQMKENTIIPNYVNQALINKRIEVWGEGKRQQNYIFVDDVCLLVKNIIQNHDKVKNEVILGVNNREYSNLDLARIIADETRCSLEFINIDSSISLNYNSRKTENLLNWNPISEFKQEIIKYIIWKQKQS